MGACRTAPWPEHRGLFSPVTRVSAGAGGMGERACDCTCSMLLLPRMLSPAASTVLFTSAAFKPSGSVPISIAARSAMPLSSMNAVSLALSPKELHHVSYVTHHMSHVTRHTSHVTSHMLHVRIACSACNAHVAEEQHARDQLEHSKASALVQPNSFHRRDHLRPRVALHDAVAREHLALGQEVELGGRQQPKLLPHFRLAAVAQLVQHGCWVLIDNDKVEVAALPGRTRGSPSRPSAATQPGSFRAGSACAGAECHSFTQREHV